MLSEIAVKAHRARKSELEKIYIGDRLPAEQTIELYEAFCGKKVASAAEVSRTELGSAMLSFAVEAYNKLNAE